MKKLLLPFLFLLVSCCAFAQSVSPAGLLNKARIHHESQLLSDGRVLVFGGNDYWISNLVKYVSAELYDPQTKTWSFAASMSQERDHFSSVLLNDGTVLAIGGMNQTDEELSSCERYDPATDTWQSISSMAAPRALHKAVKLNDGKVLVAGGSIGKTSEIYNPTDNTWTSAGNMQREHGPGMAMILLDDGKVLATGGQLSPTSPEIFDPATRQWTLLYSGTTRSRYYHDMVKLKTGDVLIVGAQSMNSYDLKSAEIFNPRANTFYNVGNPVTEVGAGRMVLLDDGRVLLYSIGDLFNPTNSKCIQIYDNNTRAWTTQTYGFLGANLASVHLLHDGKVLLAGGAWTTGNGASNSSFVVNQDAFAGCTPPDLMLSVSGSSTCNGKGATVTIPATESGVQYEAYIGDVRVSGTYAGGGSLAVSIPEDKLAPGKNIIRIKALKPGCAAYTLKNKAHVTVQMPATSKPSIIAGGPVIFCSGGSVELAGPAGMAGYEWSTGATTQRITVSTSGFYRLRVKDQDGCYSDYSDIIEVNSPPKSVLAGSYESVCANLPPFKLAGFSPAGGVWSGAGVSADGIFNPALAGAGNHTLTYSFCGISASKVVAVTAVPKVNDFTITAGQNSLCYGESTYIEIAGAMQGVKYEVWLGDKLIVTTQANYYSSYIRTSYFSIKDSSKIIVKGIYTNGCGADMLTKELDLSFYVDPRLPVKTDTPFLCKKNAGIIYLLNSQQGVPYQLMNGNETIGEPQTGTGGTLQFNTGPLFETTTFTIVASTYYYCRTTLHQAVTIEVAGPLTHFTVDNYNPEVGEPIQVLNSSINPGGSYKWVLESGASVLSSTAQDLPPVTFSKAGPTYIKLISFGVEGCNDTVSIKLNVIEPVSDGESNFSLTSASNSYLTPLAITTDTEDNSYMFFSGDRQSHNYGMYGDSLQLFPDDEEYNKLHTLVKYNAKGVIQWATFISKKAGGGDGEVVVDPHGNVYVAYHHEEHLSDVRAYSTDGKVTTFYPPHDAHGHYSVVILKYNKYGILQWHQTYLEQYTSNNVNLALDQDLNLYVSSDLKLYKYDQDGNLLWNKATGYSDIAVDSKGNLVGVKPYLLVVDKYNAAGDMLFSSPEPVKAGDRDLHITPYHLSLDRQDNIYIAADFSGEFSFKKDTLSDIFVWGDSHQDVFICKLNQDGSPDWLKQISTSLRFSVDGMDVKDDRLIFSGVAYGGEIRFNKLPNKTYADRLTLSHQTYIGVTDTSSTGSIKIKPLDNGPVAVYLLAQPVTLSKGSGKVLFVASFNVDQFLGRDVLIKRLPELQADLLLVRTTAATLFPPMAPVSRFYTSGVNCESSDIRFFDMSSEDPNSWTWSFPGANPSTSDEQHPVVRYSAPGTYLVSLVARNAIGEGNTFTYTVEVGASPQVTHTLLGSLCVSQGPVTLSGGSPADGTYSGPGVTNGVFDPAVTGTGIFTVTYTYSDKGCVSSYQSQIEVTTCTGVADETEIGQLSVYPNPTTGKFILETDLLKTQPLSITVYSTEGRSIFRNTLPAHTSGKAAVDISGYPRGMYHIQLLTNDGRILRRNVIIN
ncbi:kelch repeat-containing protein [Pontibacter locisalis]|uniref:Kelch repeat-containing protein n=1 Tax=Pontibacter locisalis TaxID=1719035 RepID=A0ABW5IMU7_9BACT